MLKGVLIGLFIFFSISGFSQNLKIAEILKAKEIKTDYYDMAEAGSWVLYLPIEFGKFVFTYSQEGAISKLKDAIIARIDLVYSDYPAGQDFTALTKKRIESLEKVMPAIFNNTTIEFRKIRQTIAKTRSVAESLQHGFFIYFRTKPTKEKAKEEVENLKSILAGKTDPADMPKKTKDTRLDSIMAVWCGSSTVLVDTTDMLKEGSLSNPLNIPLEIPRVVKKMATKEYLKSGMVPEITPKDYVGWDTVYHVQYGVDCPTFSTDFFLYQITDSTVSTVFKRNKWGKAIVIADVTGSMYPYTGQLLKWLAVTLTDKQKRHFVFFNDGDNKDDAVKVIGKTGGIYSAYSNSYDEIEKTIEKAMLNGGGGDAPENNIEALLESDKLCTDCDSIVMIVDNWAPIKDISLLGKYNKPVKVVVCGVFGRINKDYLKLVRDTKGSLHLIEEDIYNLSELKEGESIKIHGRVYKLVKGEFVDIGSLST